jgi:predicted AAA+ superfamily ATPase
VLRDLLERHSPCVVLIDELVAYIRQFPESQAISGGSYDSNLSFVQALTEAVKLVPRAIVLASLPESDLEAGSQRGVTALRALEKTFRRVQALEAGCDRGSLRDCAPPVVRAGARRERPVKPRAAPSPTPISPKA